MKRQSLTPSFAVSHSASAGVRSAAPRASNKDNIEYETVLRRTLRAMGHRHRRFVPGVPSGPDRVFARQNLGVFCDGDFWRRRNLESRLAHRSRVHDAAYWVENFGANVWRNHAASERLSNEGWHVVRLGETDLFCDPVGATAVVAAHLRSVCTAAPNNSMPPKAPRAAADAER